MTQPWDDALDALSVLVDPVRRSMYRFARTVGRPVSREEVAEATGSSVKLAAFHLDKLVEHGWLRAQYDPSSRPATGGRPPKQYTPTERQVELSLPARRYDLMAAILLDASARETDDIVKQARQVAFDRGRAAAERSRTSGRRGRLGADRTLAAAVELLAGFGFEPRQTGQGGIVMANCPFRSLADTAPATVCEAAKALAEGLLAGLGGFGVEVAIDRADDRCCVVLRRSKPRRA